jgi:cyclin A
MGDIWCDFVTLQAEQLRRPRNDYIGTIQKDINANMRGILVDWLVDVVDEFRLLPDTLYLAVSYIDRFLTASVISRNKLQLLGVASLFVAA